jgi:hypothetical protein
MWGLFGYYWRVVLSREIGPGTVRAMLLLVSLVLIGLAITILWVGHNLRLARKFEGRRRGTREAPDPELARDTIGRNIAQPGLARLRAARIVDIDADEDTKTYIVADGEAAP